MHLPTSILLFLALAAIVSGMTPQTRRTLIAAGIGIPTIFAVGIVTWAVTHRPTHHDLEPRTTFTHEVLERSEAVTTISMPVAATRSVTIVHAQTPPSAATTPPNARRGEEGSLTPADLKVRRTQKGKIQTCENEAGLMVECLGEEGEVAVQGRDVGSVLEKRGEGGVSLPAIMIIVTGVGFGLTLFGWWGMRCWQLREKRDGGKVGGEGV